ncbi:murein DD-endopeptidase MepM/ murein hydrolase activator NlpD [Paenibacillus sp. BK033]|uniref:LysM peptidoglycan-binding domain-containing M23 family metallopeptidase n=1 Tax=Paenibacillus sp. BK033 TaxID=2512133 RepID=UPI00104CDE07|nr:M23 family metallopeptidase [Paenibacillus sp. BK033]TCM96836.1 murein DD-endopeptidase MepM/ murein hydrolase activator NlpD [Paenibacillus sp. BK033]
MTVFSPKDRFRKTWNLVNQYFRPSDPQDSKGKKQPPSTGEGPHTPMWKKKPVMLTAGVLVVLAAAGIGGTGYVQANTVDYYNVYKDGNIVGSVSDPAEVEQLIQQRTEEVKKANPELNMVLDTGEITYSGESGFKADPETEETLGKLKGLLTSHAEGVELVIDGKVAGVVKNQETADAILNRVQSKYAPQLAAAKKQNEVKTLSYSKAEAEKKKTEASSGKKLTGVKFVEEVKIDEVEVDPSKIMDANELYLKLVKGSVKPTKYTVQKGDCIGCIADKFNISEQVIYDNNGWIEQDMIKEGDVLDLTVLQPELTVKTEERQSETITYDAPVEIRKSDSMKLGESKVLTEGKSGKKTLTYRVVKQNGKVVTEELVDSQVIVKPVAEVIIRGTKVILGEGTGHFASPVSGWSLSSKFGQRWGRMHKGIDMTGGKTIMAADNGVIEFVGQKTGYGNCIIVNHKNGYKTLYGHLKSIGVKKGQIVEKGDSLGIMGSTGESTGVHLHFEITKNGVLQNPLKYL